MSYKRSSKLVLRGPTPMGYDWVENLVRRYSTLYIDITNHIVLWM